MNTKQIETLKAAWAGFQSTEMSQITKAYNFIKSLPQAWIIVVSEAEIDFLSDVAIEAINEMKEDGEWL
mgnify:CR=1 FL=1|jgi:hypothetical protein